MFTKSDQQTLFTIPLHWKGICGSHVPEVALQVFCDGPVGRYPGWHLNLHVDPTNEPSVQTTSLLLTLIADEEQTSVEKIQTVYNCVKMRQEKKSQSQNYVGLASSLCKINHRDYLCKLWG